MSYFIIFRNYKFLTMKKPSDTAFNLHLIINIPEQIFVYQTGFFELIKWAWIQYFAIFIVIHFFTTKLFEFILENHCFLTIVDAN